MIGEACFPQSSAFLQEAVSLLQDWQLNLCFFVPGAGRASRFIQALLERGEVGNRQLELDHLAVAHWVDCSHDVRHVWILEAAHDVDYRISLADVGQKLVA